MNVENTQPASTETVETPQAVPQTVETVDYEAQLTAVLTTAEQLAEENKKLAEERDNYKKGLLSAKSKIKSLKDDGYQIDDDEDLEKSKATEERLAKIENLLTQVMAKKEEEVESTAAKLNKTISELKVSLTNRAPVSSAPTGSGSNLDKPEVNNSKWSKEQLEELKRRGLDPNKVSENMQKNPYMVK